MRLTITMDLDNETLAYAPGQYDEAAIAALLTTHAERLTTVGVNHARPGETVDLFTILTADGDPVGAFRVTG